MKHKGVESYMILAGVAILVGVLVMPSVISEESQSVEKIRYVNEHTTQIGESLNTYVLNSDAIFNCALCCDHIDISKDKTGHEECMGLCLLYNGRCMSSGGSDYKPSDAWTKKN